MDMQQRWMVVCGSLRPESSSKSVLDQIVSLLPETVEAHWYDGLGRLPHFDDQQYQHPEVQRWENELRMARVVLIGTPEYAFGVPGSLKNALDWTVASTVWVDKPVGLVTASSQGQRGHAALLDILSALSTDSGPSQSLLMPFIRSRLNTEGRITDTHMLEQIKEMLNRLLEKGEKYVPVI